MPAKSSKPFKPVADAQRRDIRMTIRLNGDEDATIRHSATIRDLDPSEFVRRAALGRRADVRFETEVVLSIRESVKAIRGLHQSLTETGAVPQEALMREVLLEAIAAIQRVAK